jgi:hypothetical protein
MFSFGPKPSARARLGLFEQRVAPTTPSRFRVALDAILAVLGVLAAYSWHQERDIADQALSRAEVAERRLAVCTGCAQSWEGYRAATNHRRAAK